MELDDIKVFWKQESPENEKFKEDFLEKMKTSNPLSKLRTMMKWEFIATWIFILSLIAIPILSPIKNKLIHIFVYLALNLTVMTTIFYHVLFYKIYRGGMKQATNSFMHLVEFIAEYRVALNLYRCYNYTLVVFLVPAVLLYRFKFNFDYIETITTPLLWLIIFFTSIAIILVVIFCEIWIKYFYGKYLKELEHIKSQFYS